MVSPKPQDYGDVLLPPDQASAVYRTSVALGQFTAGGTATVLAMAFDRRAVIREIWFVADAVPADADGAMTVNVHVRDASEDAFDAIVSGFDAEGLTTAFEAARATLEAETTESERTVEAGDSLRVQLVNGSVAIDANANLVMLVLWQSLEALLAE